MAEPRGNIALLIGPEGGLSEREIEQAMSFNFKPLALGPRVLRTENRATGRYCYTSISVGGYALIA